MAANVLNVGQVVRAVRARSGESGKGPYELLVTANDNGKCEINVWVMNRPSNVPVNGNFTIKKINKVSFGWKAREVNGEKKFDPKVDIDAEVQYVQTGLENVPDGNYDPLTAGDNPFEDESGLPF